MLKNASDKKSQTVKPEGPNGANAEIEGMPAATDVPRFVAPTHGGVDILKLLTELEDLVENTHHGPFGMLLKFDEDKFHMMIMKIRANLPEEMKRASKLARDSERIVEETRESAERVKENAQQSAITEMERAKLEVGRLRDNSMAEVNRLRETSQAEANKLREAAHAEIVRNREAAQREATQIQEEGRKAAEELVAEARMQAADMLSDSEIIRQAQQEARNVVARAEQEADAVRNGADEYARDVLANLEGVLAKAVTQVQRGREMLETK